MPTVTPTPVWAGLPTPTPQATVVFFEELTCPAFSSVFREFIIALNYNNMFNLVVILLVGGWLFQFIRREAMGRSDGEIDSGDNEE